VAEPRRNLMVAFGRNASSCSCEAVSPAGLRGRLKEMRTEKPEKERE
jgi:hypothetical protein